MSRPTHLDHFFLLNFQPPFLLIQRIHKTNAVKVAKTLKVAPKKSQIVHCSYSMWIENDPFNASHLYVPCLQLHLNCVPNFHSLPVLIMTLSNLPPQCHSPNSTSSPHVQLSLSLPMPLPSMTDFLNQITVASPQVWVYLV